MGTARRDEGRWLRARAGESPGMEGYVVKEVLEQLHADEAERVAADVAERRSNMQSICNQYADVSERRSAALGRPCERGRYARQVWLGELG